ncbi:MAG TPA: chemotaxis protein MotB, partial [Alphaproteobacteria bacterium]|nr:chemotaxis protein MotB [Alphaproteobacteria bacterium]
EQKRGIADYFAPSAVSKSESGSGGVMGGTSPAKDGAKSEGSAAFVVQIKPADEERRAEKSKDNTDKSQSQGLRGSTSTQGARELSAAASRLRTALQTMPDLTELSQQVLIEETEEGLRIQLIDQDER